MSILVTLALLACFDDTVVIDPPISSAPALDAGFYEIQVVGIEDLECEGVRPQDLIGQSVEARLAVDGEAVELEFEGWLLSGTMRDGALSLDGEAMWGDDEPPSGGDDPEPVDDDDDADTGGSWKEYEEEEYDPPEQAAGSVALDASVVSERLGAGILAMEIEGCSMQLEVALLFVGPDNGDDTVVIYEEETGTTGCEDDSDCR